MPNENVATEQPKVCQACGREIEPLAEFPGPMCLDCYAAAHTGLMQYTAKEVKEAFRRTVKPWKES